MVDHRHVVADEYHRPMNAAQVFLAYNSGPAHDARRGQDDQIEKSNSQPA